VDTEFLQKQYHILCNTYPKGDMKTVVDLLSRFSAYTRNQRARIQVN